MFRFGSPDLFYLLLLIPLTAGCIWYGFRQKRLLLGRFGDLDLLGRLAKGRSPRRQKVKAVLILGALLFLLLALFRPQFGTRVETVKREGQDIFVAVDVSLSMLAQDIRPSRLEKAKRAVAELIGKLDGDRIGLIAFAGEAFVQCPLTLDYGAARMFLSSFGPDLIPTPGTAVADAIQKAIDSFVKSETKSKVLVIITDGEDHDGSLKEKLEIAAESGVVIHTIGIGTAQGVPIPIWGDNAQSQGFKKDRQGQIVLTRLDEQTLRTIADSTGGESFRVSESGVELDTLYELVASMDTTELDEREVTIFDEKFQWIAGLGFILLLLELLIPEAQKVSSEWRGRFQ